MGTGMYSLLMDLPVHSLDFLCQSHFDTSLDNNLCEDQSKKLQVITGNSSFLMKRKEKVTFNNTDLMNLRSQPTQYIETKEKGTVCIN